MGELWEPISDVSNPLLVGDPLFLRIMPPGLVILLLLKSHGYKYIEIFSYKS